MFKKGIKKIHGIFFLLFYILCIGKGLAQELEVLLEDNRDCNQNIYCVSIQLKTAGETKDIGTSSVFLRYNPTALAFSSYTSSHFDGSDQCIENKAASWDVQTFDATSTPGFFNVTMTLLTNQFSCPSIGEEATEVGILCFTVLDEQKPPNLKILKNNTNFNSNIPNTGEKLLPLGKVAAINNATALQCTSNTIDCNQQELWQETEVELTITSCEELTSFCTGISFNNKGVYELMVNDHDTKEVKRCENGKTLFFYTYSSLLKLEKEGDFEVVNWEVEGNSHQGKFNNTSALIKLLNEWDSVGNWTIDEKTNTIIGGQADQGYGSIKIKNKDKDVSITMALNKKVSDYDAAINLPEGVHQIMATNKQTQCQDVIEVTVTCSPVAEDRVEAARVAAITISKDTSLCLSDFISANDYIEDCSQQTEAASNMSIDNQTKCIQLFPKSAGTDNYCLYICDEDDNCKTLQLTVEVVENLNPILRNDQVAIDMNEPRIIDVMDNDLINEDITSFDVPYTRMDGSVEVDQFDQAITYTPALNVCGILDSFQYKVATEVGESIATVYVEILCEKLTVFSGFSPNGDGINDYLKIMGIENFEENELVIFNSRGNEVYSKRGYQNEDGWDGTWKGKPLPDGTYFYMLHINQQAPISGYLQIQR